MDELKIDDDDTIMLLILDGNSEIDAQVLNKIGKFQICGSFRTQ